jgi:hypothetical protein
MRIAVLVYGRLKKCVDHYSNIIDHIGNHNQIDFFMSSDNASESVLNDFIRLYNPILYNNDPIEYECDLGTYPGRREETQIHNMTCHFINKNRVFSLLENYINGENVNYDAVISLRIDSVYTNRFDFANLADNTIYIPLGNDFVENGINDQIAYGKVEVMKKYNSINPKELLDKGLSIPHPETLTLANIYYNNLIIERVNLQYSLNK